MNKQIPHNSYAARLLATATIFALTGHAHATCYVSAGATGLNNGKSWADGYTSLQFALLDTSCSEIWVRKGVYKPTLSSTDQNVSFVIPPGTAIYGGFVGNESSRAARNPTANPTILSGDIDSNDANAGTSDINEHYYDIAGNNSFNIISMDGSSGVPITSSTVLDGFTITGTAPHTLRGKGLSCDGSHSGGSCSPTLANLVFSGNADRAVFLQATDGGNVSPTLQNVIFRGNQDAVYSIVYSSTANAKLSDVTFVDNDGVRFFQRKCRRFREPDT